MSKNREEKALRMIVDFYVSSDDFNGIPASYLAEGVDLPWSETRTILEKLLSQQSIVIAFPSVQDNPHILRTQPPAVNDQISHLHREPPDTFCLYEYSEASRPPVPRQADH